MKKLLALIALVMAMTMLVALPATAFGAGKKVYVVIMTAKPAVAYKGGVKGLQATKPESGRRINVDSARVNKYQRLLRTKQNKALRAVGVPSAKTIYRYTVSLNGFAVQLTKAQAEEMAHQPGVAMVLPDQKRYATTDNSPTFLGLNAPGGPWSKGYTGEGVVVGMIDTGIWPEHPSFADDGTYMPMPAYEGLPYEFGNTAANPYDAPYTTPNNKLLGARQMLKTYRLNTGADPDEFDSARDDEGHGTHTTSTVAGNAGVAASIQGVSYGKVSGIAPRARIIAYKALGNLGGYTSDLAAAIDQAVSDGVDVINYSIGGGAGSPAADDIAFLYAADAGVFVAASAGNDGPAAETVGSPGVWPWLTTVGASTQDRTYVGSVKLGDSAVYHGTSIAKSTARLPLVDAAALGNEFGEVGFSPADVAGKIVLVKRGGVPGRVEKSMAVYQAGGAGMILYNTSDSQDMETDTHWVPTVQVNNTDGLAIKAYIAATAEPVARIKRGVFTEIEAPWMASFSSRGPNAVAADIIKPDITAPGVSILAGASPFTDYGYVPGELFQMIAGTSMSSPHVAGAFALLKQVHPDWTAAMAKSALMTTAYQDVMKEDGVTQADPFDMGSGHLNFGSKADRCAHHHARHPQRRIARGSPFEPGLVYDAGFNDYLGFLCDVAPEVFADPDSTRAYLDSIGVPTQAYDLNYPSIGIAELPGSMTVSRTVTSVAHERSRRDYAVSVDAPDGYKVKVKPCVLRLKSGQSATYKVTITNLNAPIGEWRFGSLTWSDKVKHGLYKARSPIAVKATLFKAPAEISGSGENGSSSFSVTFGYTGSYTAAAHGLVPATVTSSNVLQDPDQNFDPADGFSDLQQFDLKGAAFFRLVLPPDGTEADNDLDVYVYDPNGELYATSTRGGTDEQVDITSPMDGTWSVYVHGWQTIGADSDYTMYSWAISAAPGGNMTVDLAPASATLGVTGTINVSWTGGTAGQWHLGAVSHTGPSGLMGLTLVDVDNR